MEKIYHQSVGAYAHFTEVPMNIGDEADGRQVVKVLPPTANYPLYANILAPTGWTRAKKERNDII